MFKTYDFQKRFVFLEEKLKPLFATGLIQHTGRPDTRKTISCYGESGNFFIDSSDGVNEDLGIMESCGRIFRVIQLSNGRPFLMFKTSYSPVRVKAIQELAREYNGEVLPFFIMCYYGHFYDYLLANRKALLEEKSNTKKEYDIGFCSGLEPYDQPKADLSDSRIIWLDKEYFGYGLGKDTGYYKINTRRNLYDKLNRSRFKFFHKEKIEYKDYLRESFKWKVCLNPPGCGEYTARMLEHSALGQAVVLRKNTYDNAISYKSSFPEVDFNEEGWEDKLQEIIDNYEYWEGKSADYYNSVYDSPTVIVDYLLRMLKRYGIN